MQLHSRRTIGSGRAKSDLLMSYRTLWTTPVTVASGITWPFVWETQIRKQVMYAQKLIAKRTWWTVCHSFIPRAGICMCTKIFETVRTTWPKMKRPCWVTQKRKIIASTTTWKYTQIVRVHIKRKTGELAGRMFGVPEAWRAIERWHKDPIPLDQNL